jgi:SAM-dependent methyltransferase
VARCLLCGSAASFGYDVTADSVRRSLAALYKDPAVAGIAMPDYRMFRCDSCQLEFADPPTPGSDEFYKWTVGHEDYYPAERWEWAVVRQKLERMCEDRGKPVTVVDVGCGAGDFLDTLRNVPGVRAVGIDITASSVETCRARGHEAYCTTLQDAKRFITTSIDVITAFHCLEHVADPLALVCQSRDLLGGGGRLMISTPYSPMSFEETWFDPLNHPPHHITRWTEKPYRILADRTGLGLTVIPGPVRGLLGRTEQAFMLRLGLAPNYRSMRRRLVGLASAALRHPLALGSQLIHQMRRRRLNDKPAPDVIMVELSKPDPGAGQIPASESGS